MDDELVLLTSYFNLANGRRQDSADTFRVDATLPSATSPDGTAALYVVTEASTGGHVGPRARRLAADTIAWEYSSQGDQAPSRRLKVALQTAHEEVLREFDGHVTIGASVIAVEGENIFLAQAAPGQVYVLHEGNLHSIAASTRGSSPYSHGLGSKSEPETRLFRDAIGPGDVIALCPSWYHRAADAEELRECFAGRTADEIAEALLELAREHDVRESTVIVIEAAQASDIAEDSAEAPAGLMEQVDMAVQALASVGKLLMTELRGEPANVAASRPLSGSETGAAGPESSRVGAPSPIEYGEPSSPTPYISPTETAIGSSAESGFSDDGVREQMTEEFEALGPEPSVPSSEAGTTIPIPAIDETSGPAHVDVPEEAPASEMERVNSRLQNELDMGEVIPPIQAFPDTSTEPSRIYATSKDIQAVNRRPRRFGGVSRPDDSAHVLRPALADINIRQRVGRPAPPTSVWASIAGLVIVAIVAIYFLAHRGGAASTPPYLAYARQDVRLARASKLWTKQDLYLSKAKKNLDLASQVGLSPASIRSWRTKVASTADSLRLVTRESTPNIVASFAGAGQLADSTDTLYVLDATKHTALSLPLTPPSSPTVIVQPGESDNGFTIGNVTQIATAGSTALVLDNNNILVRDNAGTKTATPLAKLTPTQKTKAMANSGPDVYLLDPAGNQIWRYADAVQGYTPQPAGFFPPNGPNIRGAVAFTLDDRNIYVLLSGGKVLRFDLQGNPIAYTFTPRIPLVRPDSIFTDVGLPYVWIADPASHQIVELGKSGKYIRSYMSGSNKINFANLKAIAVPPDNKWLYALTGTRLFRFSVVP